MWLEVLALLPILHLLFGFDVRMDIGGSVAQLMSQHYSYYAQNKQNILYSSIVTNELQCE